MQHELILGQRHLLTPIASILVCYILLLVKTQDNFLVGEIIITDIVPFLPLLFALLHRLIGLKNIFARQLPNMPKEYIVRLVMDR
jgi:hypothetical protein